MLLCTDGRIGLIDYGQVSVHAVQAPTVVCLCVCVRVRVPMRPCAVCPCVRVFASVSLIVQVKRLPLNVRVQLAHLIVALADGDDAAALDAYKRLGTRTKYDRGDIQLRLAKFYFG